MIVIQETHTLNHNNQSTDLLQDILYVVKDAIS